MKTIPGGVKASIPLAAKLRGLETQTFRHIVKVLHEVNARADADTFAGLAADEAVFDMKVLSVRKELRTAGLGTHLLRETMELARKKGFRRIKCEATSE